ncbi:MAG: DNA translocase FtsK [Candidatus Sumerlaeota bacterium]|nr:DNA translocase FtsK [Candidatus Sumerlaeota bacterium]
MFQAPTRRATRFLGLREENLNEIASIFVLLIGLILLLSLTSESDSGNLIGRLGSFIHSILTFVFGRYVAFLAPLMAFAWSVSIWRGHHAKHLPVRVLGIFLASCSMCALVAVGHANDDFRGSTDAFRAGGAIGNFLMHREILALRSIVGVAGSYLFFVGLLIVAVILATDAQLRPVLVQALAVARFLHPRRWMRWLAFWNYVHLPRWSEPADPNEWTRQEAAAAVAVAMNHPTARRAPRQTAEETSEQIAAAQRTAAARRTARFAETEDAEEDTNAILDALEGPHTVAPPARRRTASPQQTAPQKMTRHDDLVTMAEARDAGEVIHDEPAYELPEIKLLNIPPRAENRMTRDEVMQISETIETTLLQFGISASVVHVTQGPTVTCFELQPAAGVKVSKIASLENDIAMCMKADTVRIVAPIPGKGTVGIELPNRKTTPVYLREILATDTFRNHPSPLAFALGKTISGEPYVCDLATMPHLLIAGTTGSGKSVCLNSVICSILFRKQPNEVKFIMIDPKRVELNVYSDIPHLLAPVVCDARKAATALAWATEQMDERYKRLASLGVRNIDGYNAIVQSRENHPKAAGLQLDYMPHIIIVVDELADLMLIARNEVEDSVIRLAQMSRSVGMHLIIATQRPSVNIITGIIKANFPCRVAFQVSSKVDSRTILDMNGAEALLGRGDMLFSAAGTSKPIRLQGCYVSDQEVERIADYVRQQQQAHYLKQDFAAQREITTSGQYEEDPELEMDGIDADDLGTAYPMDESGEKDLREPEPPISGQQHGMRSEREGMMRDAASSRPLRPAHAEDNDAIDETLFCEAVRVVLTFKQASVSLLQRKLRVGFARAGRLMDMMEEKGIVGPNAGSKVRKILVDPSDYLARMTNEENNPF